MKKLLILIIFSCTVLTVKAQQTERFTFATTVGTGFAMSTPAYTRFAWQVLGYYNVNKRFSAGIGSGVSLYEKALIPLFADVRFAVMKPAKLTPYLACSAGYSFAPDKNANGGLYLNPSIGIQYLICGNKKLSFALGYELQKLERLKTQEQSHFAVEFAEKLNHSSISVKIGFHF